MKALVHIGQLLVQIGLLGLAAAAHLVAGAFMLYGLYWIFWALTRVL